MLNHADNDIVEAGVVLFRNLFHFLNQLDRKIERLIPGFYFLFRFLWNKRHGLSPFLWFYCMINTYDKIYEKFLLHFSMIFYKMMGEVMEYAFATIPFVFTKKRADAF